jgi:hypothetical protein
MSALREGKPRPDLPVRRTRGLGPFVTFIEYERPDGAVARWESRRARKNAPRDTNRGSTWFAPGARGWWIGVLFAIGSFCFALGAVPGYASAAGTKADSITFFVGSLFFTSAAFLQYREAVEADGGSKGRRVFVFRPRQIDWLATAIQLLGTLWFNVSTGAAVQTDLTATALRQHVWRPDVLGSICFLAASGLAWFEVCHGWAAWSPGDLGWWITLLNLVGSVAFGVSAVAAFVVPSTGSLLDEQLSNLGTFVGALCFLVGGILLLPERTQPHGVAASPRGGIDATRS